MAAITADQVKDTLPCARGMRDTGKGEIEAVWFAPVEVGEAALDARVSD